MSNENIGISGGPSETPKRPRKPSPKKVIDSVPAPAAEEKKKSRKSRLFKDYDKAYVTRSYHGKYKTRRAAKGHGYTISMLQLDDVWYIQVTTSLARLLEYKTALDLYKANRGDIRVFMTVAYLRHSYLKPPPLDNRVHNTSFVKYDKYKEWLIGTGTKKCQNFLKFLTDIFDILQKPERDFVHPYYTDKTSHNITDSTQSLHFGRNVEETLDKDVLTDHSAVSAPETVSGESLAVSAPETVSGESLAVSARGRAKLMEEKASRLLKEASWWRQLADVLDEIEKYAGERSAEGFEDGSSASENLLWKLARDYREKLL